MNSISTLIRRIVCAIASLSVAMAPMAAEFVYQVPIVGQATAAVAPGALTISPTGHSFGALMVGSSASALLTVKNTGGDSLHLSSIDASAGYSQSNDCPSTLASGATCRVSVTFSPGVEGTYAGVLRVTDDESGASASASLSGISIVPTSTLVLSRSSLTFAGTQVGSPALTLALTVTNSGNSPAMVDGIGVTSGVADFGQSNDCAASLAPGASCAVHVSFVPSAFGLRAGTLSLYEQASGSLYSVALQGGGNAALLSANPNPLVLDNAVVEHSSSSADVTLTNGGNLPAQGLSADFGGATDFAVSGTSCSTVLAAGASCALSVTFAPSEAGSRSANLTLSSTNGTTQVVAVQATGVAASSMVTPTPASLTFADIEVGQISPSQTTTLVNTGNVPVALSDLRVDSTTAGFGLTHNCPQNLDARANCVVTVQFSPSSRGTKTSAVLATLPAGAMSVPLTGRAVQGVAAVSPTSAAFGARQVGQTSTPMAVTLTNSGDAPLVVSGISVTSGATDFAQSNNCASVPAAGSCTLNVNFTPTVAGARTGTIAIVHNGADGLRTVTLTGTGQAASAALTAPAHGNMAAGTTSDVTATLSNTGIAAIAMTKPSSASITGAGFSFVSTTCGTTLAAGAICNIVVRLTATGMTAHSGTLTVTSAEAGTKTAALSGQSQQAILALSPTARAFGNVQVGDSLAGTALTLTNSGNTAAMTTARAVTGTGMSISATTCSTGLAAGASCTITPTFAPAAAGAVTGTLTVTSGNAGTVTASVTGTGVAAASATLTTPTHGNVLAGTVKDVTAVLTNTGIVDMTMTKPATSSVTGTGFRFISTTCGTSLAASGSCNIVVRLTGAGTTTHSGSLSVVTQAGTKTGTLSGQSQQAVIAVQSNTATGMSAMQNGTPAPSGIFVFKNNGNLATTLTMSGLAAPFSVSPSSCSIAAEGTCTVTVTMATSGAVQAYSDTLVATPSAGTGTAVNASVSGSVTPLISAFSVTATRTSSAGIYKAFGTVTNNNSVAATLTDVGFTSNGNSAVAGGTCTKGMTLAAGAACTFNVDSTKAASTPCQLVVTLWADNVGGREQVANKWTVSSCL